MKVRTLTDKAGNYWAAQYDGMHVQMGYPSAEMPDDKWREYCDLLMKWVYWQGFIACMHDEQAQAEARTETP
jgi:hypothetical protein